MAGVKTRLREDAPASEGSIGAAGTIEVHGEIRVGPVTDYADAVEGYAAALRFFGDGVSFHVDRIGAGPAQGAFILAGLGDSVDGEESPLGDANVPWELRCFNVLWRRALPRDLAGDEDLADVERGVEGADVADRDKGTHGDAFEPAVNCDPCIFDTRTMQRNE